MSHTFKEYKGLDLPAIAEKTLEFWEEKDIFQKSISSREGKESFVWPNHNAWGAYNYWHYPLITPGY